MTHSFETLLLTLHYPRQKIQDYFFLYLLTLSICYLSQYNILKTIVLNLEFLLTRNIPCAFMALCNSSVRFSKFTMKGEIIYIFGLGAIVCCNYSTLLL